MAINKPLAKRSSGNQGIRRKVRQSFISAKKRTECLRYSCSVELRHPLSLSNCNGRTCANTEYMLHRGINIFTSACLADSCYLPAYLTGGGCNHASRQVYKQAACQTGSYSCFPDGDQSPTWKITIAAFSSWPLTSPISPSSLLQNCFSDLFLFSFLFTFHIYSFSY